MNLASNTAAVPSTMPSRMAAIQGMAECLTLRWGIGDAPPGVALVPGAVQLFRRDPELHDEIAGRIFWLGLSPFLAPESNQGRRSRARNSSKRYYHPTCRAHGRRDVNDHGERPCRSPRTGGS
jgi:hypothetical protein